MDANNRQVWCFSVVCCQICLLFASTIGLFLGIDLFIVNVKFIIGKGESRSKQPLKSQEYSFISIVRITKVWPIKTAPVNQTFFLNFYWFDPISIHLVVFLCRSSRIFYVAVQSANEIVIHHFFSPESPAGTALYCWGWNVTQTPVQIFLRQAERWGRYGVTCKNRSKRYGFPHFMDSILFGCL